MRLRVALAGTLAALAGTGQAADTATPKRYSPGVLPQALIAAAKHAMLSDINNGRSLCGEDRTVEAWLNDVVGGTAVSITWRGGGCELTNDLNPIDSGSHWCGGATIVPKGHPKEPADIEIYFDKPVSGKLGKAYAFRGENYDVDGLDYKRDWPSFESGYRQKYRKDFVPPETTDCD